MYIYKYKQIQFGYGLIKGSGICLIHRPFLMFANISKKLKYKYSLAMA